MLQLYKNLSSFDVKTLQIVLDTQEVIDYKKEVYKTLENDPLFHKPALSETLDDVRKSAQLRANRLIDLGLTKIRDNPLQRKALALVLAQYDTSVMFKAMISTHFFGSCVKGLGSSEQQKLHLGNAQSGKISACLALTEVAHGTDARRMRTTATYDSDAQHFVLDSQDFEAAKCWIGNLETELIATDDCPGQTATHAVVFAQLIMPDGTCHGLHAFITPIRDPLTLQPLPGVTVGDMGEKVGLNGMDNGFCMFNQHRIPRENLLSKISVVTEDGKYMSPISNPRKRFGYSLGALVGGRLSVLIICEAYLTNAVTIAVRYSAVRKQFGPNNTDELPIIEYPLHQWRLFPHLAELFAMKVTTQFLALKHNDLVKTLHNPDEMPSQEQADSLTEIHALLSALKPVFSHTTQTAIQQCREACGGHGYLKCAGFGDLRNNNDATCTYEGDNNVLQQQASNWLLCLWRERGNGHPFPSPLGSVHCLYSCRRDRMSVRTQQQLCHVPVILEAYRWLVCWLAEKTARTQQQHLQRGQDDFTARNRSQVYRAKSLSVAYAEHFMLQRLWDLSCGEDFPAERAVLSQLCSLFGLSRLQHHLPFLHQGGYVDGDQSEMIFECVLHLCEKMKNEALSLIEVIAPPDFILNSALGHSNGKVYDNLRSAFFTSPGSVERPSWWHELSGKFRSRL